jgi:phosphatidyl-myo-inositol alpha-mannosyltransferase
LRILLGCPYDLTYLGGVTNHIFDLAHQFRLQGHEVTIAGSNGSGNVKRTGVHKLGGSIPFYLPGDAARVNLTPWIHFSVKKLLSRQSFDVFHLHEPFLGYIGPSFMRLGEGLKIGTFHSSRTGLHWPYAVFNPIVRNWNRMLDGRIAVPRISERLSGASQAGRTAGLRSRTRPGRVDQ